MHGITLLENTLEHVFLHVIRVPRVNRNVWIEDRELCAAFLALEKYPLVPLDALPLWCAQILPVEELVRSTDDLTPTT